jgi:hypothetical protein
MQEFAEVRVVLRIAEVGGVAQNVAILPQLLD